MSTKKETKLLRAVRDGRVTEVVALLDQGVDIECQNEKGNTALFTAASKAQDTIVVLLLERGADITARNYKGWTALHASASEGHYTTVALLLEWGADITAENQSGRTALHKASERGHDITVTILLEMGADIAATDKIKLTAIHHAAKNGHDATVFVLLERGADINAKSNDGSTALHKASANGHDTTVNLLLEKGADISAKDNVSTTPNVETHRNGRTALDVASSEAIRNILRARMEVEALTARDKYGLTPLLRAAENCDDITVTALLDRGADITARDKEGSSALHLAAFKGSLSIVALLLDRGADIDVKNRAGQTALRWAACWGRDNTVTLLLDRGADIEAKNKGGSTALHGAASGGEYKIVCLLLDRGADITATDNGGSTALHGAASRGMDTTVTLLLDRGADITATDNEGCFALHLATFKTKNSTITLLLDRGADIEAKNNGGSTALHGAASRGKDISVTLLLDRGADLTATDNEGSSALHLAAVGGWNSTVILLLDRGADIEAKNDAGKRAIDNARESGHIETVEIFVQAVKAQQQRVFRQLSSVDPVALPYASLHEWTGGFVIDPAGDGPYGMLGRGAFGEVFKGLAVPPEGSAGAAVRFAVKRMDTRVLQLEDARESLVASFRREILVLSRFRHPNVVRLIGFSEPCPERKEPPCLVYELLALGSLSIQLRDDAKAALLPWQCRVDILLQISTAINYLHCHNLGYPAYHRDIKADNIALSVDYTAKLIDCGLSKYIAEDGYGRSIMSATGLRFGTPGYMCPFYTEGATDYDTKSEVYSFGIVLLEVLTGRLQGSRSDGKKTMLHRSIGNQTVDTRAGVWPKECVSGLICLARQCIAEYDDRIESMKTVIQQLRQIKADSFPQPTTTESVIQQRMAALIAQNEAMSLARDVATATAAQSARKCLVCFDDDLLATDGFECTLSQHFVCKKNGCFARITKDQSDSKARFAANAFKILCTVPGCGEVIEDHLVATFAGEEGFGAFLRAKLAAREEQVVREYEYKLRTLRAEVQREEKENCRRAEQLRHRNHIIEELLAIKCPNHLCQLVFIMDDDSDFCFALHCSGCGSHFCGWCLCNFGSTDAHSHVVECRPEPLQPRGLFPHHENDKDGVRYSAKQCFDQVHGPRRAAAVKAYLDAQHFHEGEREAVIAAVAQQWTLLNDNIALS